MQDRDQFASHRNDSITVAALSENPYPIYRQLQRNEPVAWAPSLNMWLVTKYDHIRTALLNTEALVVGTPASLLFKTFGEHMLTTEGETHRRYRDHYLQGAFMRNAIVSRMQACVTRRVSTLIDGFCRAGQADLRAVFASRLPILVMLDLFGLPAEDEQKFRDWYDAFEAALANQIGDEAVQSAAAERVDAFETYIQAHMDKKRTRPLDDLLSDFLSAPEDRGLRDDEIRRNALIIFFGGISTVEAVILNTLYALHKHPEYLQMAQDDDEGLENIIEETIRWLSPVQTATRHAIKPVRIGDTEIKAGAAVSLILGAANRDEDVFHAPHLFNPNRENASRHLGFATGPHLCLGRHLAKMEARIAITAILERLPNLSVTREISIEGHEFRQPTDFLACWGSR